MELIIKIELEKLTDDEAEGKFAITQFESDKKTQYDYRRGRKKGFGTKDYEKDRAAGAVTKIFDTKIGNINAKIDAIR